MKANREQMMDKLMVIKLFTSNYARDLLTNKYYEMVYLQQSLVRNGKILLGFDTISNWNTELKEVNKDKIG